MKCVWCGSEGRTTAARPPLSWFPLAIILFKGRMKLFYGGRRENNILWVKKGNKCTSRPLPEITHASFKVEQRTNFNQRKWWTIWSPLLSSRIHGTISCHVQIFRLGVNYLRRANSVMLLPVLELADFELGLELSWVVQTYWWLIFYRHNLASHWTSWKEGHWLQWGMDKSFNIQCHPDCWLVYVFSKYSHSLSFSIGILKGLPYL